MIKHLFKSSRITLCTYRIRIEEKHLPNTKDKLEYGTMFHRLKEEHSSIKKEIDTIVQSLFGTEFGLQELSIKRGSIEIIAVIGAAYYAISKYKNFIESIELARTQIENLFARRLSIDARLISSSWQPGAILLNNNHASCDSCYFNKLLIWYLIFTHFILLGIAIFGVFILGFRLLKN